MNPVAKFLAAVESLCLIPVAVLCETCARVRPRITPAETALLDDPALRAGGITCRTRGCDGRAYPLHDTWESGAGRGEN